MSERTSAAHYDLMVGSNPFLFFFFFFFGTQSHVHFVCRSMTADCWLGWAREEEGEEEGGIVSVCVCLASVLGRWFSGSVYAGAFNWHLNDVHTLLPARSLLLLLLVKGQPAALPRRGTVAVTVTAYH